MQAADRSVPGASCLYEPINPVNVTLSLACSEADLNAWLAARGLVLADLQPVPAMLPDGTLEQGVYWTESGESILLARYVSDRFFAPPARSRDEARSDYLATLGLSPDDSGPPDAFVPAGDLCDGEFALAGRASTRLSGFINLFRHCDPNPAGPFAGYRILYIEGHSSFYDFGGVDYIRWLADLGFEVFVSEMPFWGANAPDGSTVVDSHDSYVYYERDAESPLGTEIVRPFGAIYSYVKRGTRRPVGLTGRSGGGMTAYSVGMANPAVDFVVSIAGGTPLSMRLASPAASGELGDWEQWSPRTYSQVGHEELMRYGGRLGGLYLYGGLDPCCFRVAPGDGFHEWLGVPTGDGRLVEIYVDPANELHALSEAGKPVLTSFLERVLSLPALEVSVLGDAGGRVASSPAGIDCGTTCVASFPAGQVVELVAMPQAGFTFDGWSGACTGTGACVVSMSDSKSVTATFALQRFALQVTRSGDGEGRVTSVPAGIDCGTLCTAQFAPGQVIDLTARAEPGFNFVGWGGACAGTGACQVTMNDARQVTAVFIATRFALTVTRTGNGSGTVTSSPAGLDCGATCTADFLLGATVVLTASGDSISTFAGWGGACAGTGPCVVTMDAAREVTATFTRPLYALTLAPIGDGTGTVTSSPAGLACGTSCSAPFTAGTPVALNAAPGSESTFLGWGGACAGTGTCVVTMSAAKIVTAAFGRQSGIPRLRNISTRMQVLLGDNSLIGGFVIGGTQAKTVLVRARGPSLVPFGVVNALADPQLQLYSGQTVIGSNDDWPQAADADAIQALGFAPSDTRESAILATLSPGAYTAIVTGVGATTGIGIVEVFEVDSPASALVNISTRGRSSSGENVMIGGFVIQGDAPVTVIVRARGPSLAAFGITDPLVNPTLLLFAGQDFLASNEDWQDSPDAARIRSLGFAPSSPYESAILITLAPGAYTAIVRDALGREGVGIVEIFVP